MSLIPFPTLNLKDTKHEFINNIDFNVSEFLQKYFIILRINKCQTLSE